MPEPNFLIIGAARAGTTALHTYLARHPQAFLGEPKEPSFFARHDDMSIFRGPGDPEILGRWITDPAAYGNLFRKAAGALAIGEASPAYLTCPQSAARIRQRLPDVRLVAVLRDPAERAYSDFVLQRRDGREPCEDFSGALRQERGGLRDRWWAARYLGRGCYHAGLSRYYARFDRRQIKVFLYEDLRDRPDDLLRELHAFLGLDPEPTDTSVRHNEGGSYRGGFLEALLLRPNPVRAAARTLLPTALREKGAALLRRRALEPAPALDPELRRELVAHYRDEIERLQPLIGRDLRSWLA